VRGARVFQRLLGVEHTTVVSVEIVVEGGEEVLLAGVRPHRRFRSRCSRCQRHCPGYDSGEGRRRWRGLDQGTVKTYLVADAPRVECARHGVVVAAVPWARPGAKVTRAFEDTCAWLAAHATFSVLAALLRVSWRTVAAIVTRVVADRAGTVDRLDGLLRIGIDEISYRKGQRYLTAVVDHDTGRLVWAAAGRDTATLLRFFDALGPERCKALTHVSADGAEWIHAAVTERAPQAKLCLDPFHVVAWASDALDEVRRGLWNDLRQSGKTGQAASMKGSRWALIKNPQDLTPDQRASLATIQADNKALYRAYLLKEQLRAVFAARGIDGRRLLAGWLSWAKRSQLPGFVKLAATIQHYLPLIRNTLDEGLSNALAEATNTHLRILTRRAYGFHSPDALIAMRWLIPSGLGIK
jgi:transposase